MLAICQHCKVEFEPRPRTLGKYCSIPCWRSSNERKEQLKKHDFTKNLGGYARGEGTPWNKGKKFPEYSGESNPNWKKEGLNYKYLHKWLNQVYGRPDQCEHCGLEGLKEHKIHWANKSHEYKRDRSDWMRLCVKCHAIYDKKGQNRERDSKGRFI